MKIIIYMFGSLLILMFSARMVNTEELPIKEVQILLQKGDVKQAIALLNTYIENHPDSINAYITLAKIHLGIGGIRDRSKAENAVRAGLQHAPKNPDLLKLLARIKGEQKLPELSAKWLERAVRADPGDEKSINKLLDQYISTGDKEKIKQIRSIVEKSLNDNPANPMIHLALGRVEIALKNTNKAISVLEKGIKLDSKIPALHRALSEAYLWDGQGDKFTEEYYNWFEIENNPNILAQEYEITELTMSLEEAQKFRIISFNDKRSYLLQYWREMDSYPISPQNERLIEHIRRVLYSKAAFHVNQGNLGFDDRGKVYIRWGVPEEHYVETMPEPVGDGEIVVLVRNNESWYYTLYGLYMAFDFVSYDGTYYNEVTSLDAALYGDFLISGFYQQLYKRREHLGGIYSMLAHDPDFDKSVKEMPINKISAHRNTIPRLEYKLDIPKLDFVYQVTQFRGDSGRTRLDVAYSVPLLQFKGVTKKDSIKAFTFQTDFVLLYSNVKRTLHTRTQQQYLLPLNKNKFNVKYVNEETKRVFPGKYQVTFQMLELSQRQGDFKIKPLQVRNFTGDSLMISDLVFSPHIEFTSIDTVTEKEIVLRMPYPYTVVNKKQLIYLYFEVYNLQINPDKKCRYKISLDVTRERTKGEFITQPLQSIGTIFTGGKPQSIETIYERESNTHSNVECIQLDLSSLRTGHSRLTVTVEDLLANKETKNNIEFDLE